MKVLKIIIKQTQANYRKEESLKNKMTYPLPPLSTIIGSIHSACGFRTYHAMDISIQGRYESSHKEPYTDYCFLNSVMDDRGILVKLKNGNYQSTAFEKVASVKKSTGNSFRNGITIDVINRELLEEYRELKNNKDMLEKYKAEVVTPQLEMYKVEKRGLVIEKKKIEKSSERYKEIVGQELEIKSLEKELKEKMAQRLENEFKILYKNFASLTTSLRYYEILNNIELIIHVKSDQETLDCILENIYNMTAIGRSEDFIHIEEAMFVDVTNEIKDEVVSQYSAYLDYQLIKEDYICIDKKSLGIEAQGTKYYMNKNYKLENKKRIFSKKKVVYTSNYSVENSICENLFIETIGNKPLIVNFL